MIQKKLLLQVGAINLPENFKKFIFQKILKCLQNDIKKNKTFFISIRDFMPRGSMLEGYKLNTCN